MVMTSFFILPIHNKEYLLREVLRGIADSCVGDFHVIAILDGCKDESEMVLRDFVFENKLQNQFTILKMNDVHEITCLNYGLTQIKMMNANPEDLVFTVQDDVVLQEKDIDYHFKNLFGAEGNLGYVSMRLGSELVYFPDGNIGEKNYFESEFGHWKQLNLSHFTVVNHKQFVKTQLAIRSPTCVQWKRYQEVGFYDPALAPCGYDCHDFSIRMIQHGYQNGVFALKYRSDVAWGGMRTTVASELNKKHGEVYEKNRRYLGVKHRSFLLANT
jgi:glycosyltransferase involved in cell wall biosynthesis